MFNKIFDIQFTRLAGWLIPTMLRTTVLVAVAKAIYQPLIAIHDNFLFFRKAKFYQISMNYQTCYLESFLNDRFDFTERRIYIEDAATGNTITLYTRAETKPIVIGKRTELFENFLYTRGENNMLLLNDFIIYIPQSITFDERELRAMIATKICGKRFKTQVF